MSDDATCPHGFHFGGFWCEVDDCPGAAPEPRRDCADPHTLRWHCMRGHDGAAPGVCPLDKCEKRHA